MNVNNKNLKNFEFELAQNINVGDIIADNFFEIYYDGDAVADNAEYIVGEELFTVVEKSVKEGKRADTVTFKLSNGEELVVRSKNQCHCGCKENDYVLKMK